MTAASVQRETEPGVRPVTWSVVVENRYLGTIELSPAGNHYAFGPGRQPKCLGLFKDLIDAGEAILAHHGLPLELVQ